MMDDQNATVTPDTLANMLTYLLIHHEAICAGKMIEVEHTLIPHKEVHYYHCHWCKENIEITAPYGIITSDKIDVRVWYDER